MKKLGSITIACLYLILSVGIAKSTHFCMDRPLSASVFSFESKKCFCSDLETKDSCCHDKYEVVKIEDDQSAGQVIDSPSPEFNLIGELFSESNKVFTPHVTVAFDAENYNLPPPKVPIYKSVCSLIFYDELV